MNDYILRMSSPAPEWENATPVGAGSIGAMLFGSPECERIALNEETVWSGYTGSTDDPSFAEKIAHMRELFLAGDNIEANRFAREDFGEFRRIRSYETAGSVTVNFHRDGKFGGYSRELDLINGVASVRYNYGGAGFESRIFASFLRRIVVYRFHSEIPLDADIAFERECTDAVLSADGVIAALCRTAYGEHPFCVKVRAETDGKLTCSGGKIAVCGATECVLYISIVTRFRSESYIDDCGKLLDASSLGFDALLAEHTADFSAIMSRSDIFFDEGDELDALPIADRLARLRNDPAAEDWRLVSLYYQFGKYLLVSSSRPGTLPANLQGVWAERMENPWNADYHTNINLQMNYWLAEQANISECTAPLFDYMNDYLLESGKRTAAVNYRTRGTVVHHLSDIYGYTAPADGVWGLWPLGGAWLAHEMWQHYLFTLDGDFLRDTAYEYIRQSALFLLDNMFEDGEGRLLSGPSTSPENEYYFDRDGRRERAYLCLSPTMDVEIIGALLRFYIEAEELLNLDPDTANAAREALEKMPKLKVGKHGQLMEWLEDYDEPEPGHRHISNAFALYPDAAITRDTPELFKAISVTLERRLAQGGGHTGWSRAWLISLFARLHDGEKSYENLRLLLTKSTLDNLFDTHPPFQIDGNFGGAAGIIEQLLQSHEGCISLLPAVPDNLPDGGFDCLKARGNVTVSARWREGRVTNIILRSETGGEYTVELPSKQRGDIFLTGGAESTLEGGRFTVSITAGSTADINISTN